MTSCPRFNITKRALRSIAAGAVALAAAGMVSTAASALERMVKVAADQATLVKVDGMPATIIVGNPAFADVTVQSGHLIVHGRTYGTTNVIVLNKNGAELATLTVHVVEAGQGKVSLYKAGKRMTYACAPSCETTLDVGDETEAFGSTNTAITSKSALAAEAAKFGQQ